MSLNLRQQRFVDEFVVSGNATQSAIAAGYSERSAPTTGHDLLRNPKVIRAIEGKRAATVEKLQITAEDIAREAWSIARADDAPHSARVSALALLAKRHPEFSDKHEITGDVRHRVEALSVVAQMTPEQLRALAEGARDGGS